jgi:hypothetical protein
MHRPPECASMPNECGLTRRYGIVGQRLPPAAARCPLVPPPRSGPGAAPPTGGRVRKGVSTRVPASACQLFALTFALYAPSMPQRKSPPPRPNDNQAQGQRR